MTMALFISSLGSTEKKVPQQSKIYDAIIIFLRGTTLQDVLSTKNKEENWL